MSTGHVLLGLLSRGQRHGYELKREHDERFPAARPLAFGQVYTTLERLHRQGLVEPVAVHRVDGPDRTVYEVTDTGRTEIHAWLRNIETPAPHVSNPLSTKVTIALLVGDAAAAADYLRRQRRAHLERMRYYTRVKTDSNSSLHEVLAADYALSHLDADLSWMETASQRVHALEKEIGT
ncbi:MAG: PadR family transcriptional regulator [Nocardioidaceae bacterium]